MLRAVLLSLATFVPPLTAQSASFQPFGTGCAGPAGVPSLDAQPGQLPVLGQTFFLRIAGLPSFSMLFGVVGLSSTWNSSPLGSYPLPHDLAAIGMPGCTQYVAADQVTLMIALANQLSWPLPIPADQALLGLQFHAQVVLRVTPSFNPLAAVVSNAGTGTIGT